MAANRHPCLFLGDPNLGRDGAAIVRRFVPEAEIRIWALGENAERGRIRDFLRSRRWSMAVSLYSDLILEREDLDAIDLPLNIHPALPSVPGLGYDIIPILEGHARCGATLHRMTERVDSGEIFDVIEHPLPPGSDRATLRSLNQRASLEMLGRWIPRLAACDSLRDRLDLLRPRGMPSRAWGTRRCSRAQARALVREGPSASPPAS